MKLNKLSLSLAITLALGSTFGMAHAETTAAHTKAKTTVTNTQAKAKETLPAGVYTDTKDNWARDAIQAVSSWLPFRLL